MAGYSAILSTDADESISVAGSAASLTLPAALAQANRATKGITGGRATIQVRTAPILFTLNGTAPTDSDAATGTRLEIGQRLVLTSLIEMDNLKMVRATSVSGAVFVFYERRVS